jgi:hypothetical protein
MSNETDFEGLDWFWSHFWSAEMKAMLIVAVAVILLLVFLCSTMCCQELLHVCGCMCTKTREHVQDYSIELVQNEEKKPSAPSDDGLSNYERNIKYPNMDLNWDATK